MPTLATGAICIAALASPRKPARAAPPLARGASRVPAVQLRARGARLLAPTNGVRCAAFFKFQHDSKSAGILGCQDRDEFSSDDVGHYFEFSGLLATETSYDRMHAMLSAGLHPVDVILLLAAAEGDCPKMEEVLAAGANPAVKDLNGHTPMDLAGKNNAGQKAEALALLTKYAAAAN